MHSRSVRHGLALSTALLLLTLFALPGRLAAEDAAPAPDCSDAQLQPISFTPLDGIPAPQPMTCSADNIAYGYGVGQAACQDAVNNAQSDCQATTCRGCCTVTQCACVGGGGGTLSCWVYYGYGYNRCLP